MDDFVFAGCTSLQTINIPNKVVDIGYQTFASCISLKTLYVSISNVEVCNVRDNSFCGVAFDNCTLYIPSGTRWTYKQHLIFRKFKNIETLK